MFVFGNDEPPASMSEAEPPQGMGERLVRRTFELAQAGNPEAMELAKMFALATRANARAKAIIDSAPREFFGWDFGFLSDFANTVGDLGKQAEPFVNAAAQGVGAVGQAVNLVQQAAPAPRVAAPVSSPVSAAPVRSPATAAPPHLQAVMNQLAAQRAQLQHAVMQRAAQGTVAKSMAGLATAWEQRARNAPSGVFTDSLGRSTPGKFLKVG